MAVEQIVDKAIEKAKQKIKAEISKAVKKLGWNFVASEVPVLGDFWPAFTIFWWQETKKNVTAADALLMFPVALTADATMFGIGLVDWADLGIIGMTIRFLGWTFFYAWSWIRNGGFTGYKPKKEKTENGSEKNPDQIKDAADKADLQKSPNANIKTTPKGPGITKK